MTIKSAVLVEGIDLVVTLKVAEAELARKTSTSEFALWGIRDQTITPEIARRISELYFANIDMLYDTAPFTARQLIGITLFGILLGPFRIFVVVGDTHTSARNRMQQLIVAPRNADYLNSYRYLENRRSLFTVKTMP